MKNLKIGTRLTLGFSFLLLLLLLLAAIGMWRVNGAQEASQQLENRRQIGDLIHLWSRQIEVNASQTLAYGAASDSGLQKAFQRSMDQSEEKAEAARQELEPMLTNPDVLSLYQIIMTQREAYTKTRDEAFKAQQSGKTDEATMLFRVRLPSQIRNYVTSVDMLNEFQTDTVAGISSSNLAANTLSLRMMGIATLLAFILGPLFALFIIRSITRPLRVAVSAAETVARRDLSQDIAHEGKDETSLLLRALDTMSHSLQDAMGEVRSGANAIASAAAQISSGNLDLSSRTEEQASSLAQTAATMEELTATVRQNADNTQQANTLAAAAAKVAIEGGTVVADVVHTMSEINSKSKQVADILGVIDSIAFQTNILALNAAVEAARAGEQGRGFAVVAAEVRALAQRSATAAKEIKTLIDASVAATTTGNEQAARAGKTMEEVVTGINRVTDIMGEISAASREQTTGIEEINSAVMQMDDVTRQNASLVEESAAAAASLQDQAHTLEALVETFKLSENVEVTQSGDVPALSMHVSGATPLLLGA